MSPANRVLISLVVPVYREELNLRPFYAKVIEVTNALESYQWEFIFINDGSPDQSKVVLAELAQQDERVKVLNLSRNFGKEIAISAGLEAVQGEAVIAIDADLQHPPELIPELLEKWEEGFDIVATIRTEIEKQPLMRKLGSYAFYWLMHKISSVEMISQTTDYRLIDRRIVEIYRTIPERSRMFRGIVDWMGFNKVYVQFKAGARNQGEAGYTYKKLINLAITSITSFSVFPLKLAAILGLCMTSISSLLAMVMIPSYFFDFEYLVFTPLALVIVLNTFLIGVVLIALGVMALYIGSIHGDVTGRPLYLLESKHNLQSHFTNREARKGVRSKELLHKSNQPEE